MRVDLFFPAFPPAFDGIGDYTAHLANTLSGRHDVRVWTSRSADAPEPESPPSEAEVRAIPALTDTAGLANWVSQCSAAPPDWLVIQYNPFSYGTRGYAPALAPAIKEAKRRSPSMKVAVTVHEPFMPPDSLRFMIMSIWQRRQFKQIGELADQLIFTIPPWVERFASWFPNTPCTHVPVGSNMPRVAATKQEARMHIGLSDERCVLGLFGRARSSRLFGHIRAGLRTLERAGHRPLLVYIGGGTEVIRTAFADHRVHCTGTLPGDQVSRHLSALDVYLAPYHKGVSTRRGAFLAGMQHALPVLTTHGPQTDDLLAHAAGRAFCAVPVDDSDAFAETLRSMVESPALQHQLGRNARSFYLSHFTWPVIAAQYNDVLRMHTPVPAPVPSLSSNLHPWSIA